LAFAVGCSSPAYDAPTPGEAGVPPTALTHDSGTDHDQPGQSPNFDASSPMDARAYAPEDAAAPRGDVGPAPNPCEGDPCGAGSACAADAGQPVCSCRQGFVAAQPTGCKLGPLSIAAGLAHACALREDGVVKCWGFYGDRGTSISPKISKEASNVVALAAGGYHDCAIQAGGTVICWGDNEYGQLGAGVPGVMYEGLAASPRGLEKVQHLYAGQLHSCIVTEASTVQCWGEQLATGTGAAAPVGAPTSVPIDGVNSLGLGQDHTCALKLDGTVYCWGGNAYGQVGNGTKTAAPKPVKVAGITGATEVAGGDAFSCALTAGGLYCWGTISYQKEAGSAETVDLDSTTPVPFPAPAGAHNLKLGGAHICVLDADERLWCRGANRYGQLGNATFTSTREFVKVQELERVEAYTVGWGFNCARLADSRLACWGENDLFQLGLSYNVDMWLPTVLTDL
jgi:alpha-tubulin suppressor-like RCC1 family protein